MKTSLLIIIGIISCGVTVSLVAGTLSYQQTYNQRCIEGGDRVTGFLQCTGMNCDFGFPKNTTGISIPKKIFVSEESEIFPNEVIIVLGTNSTVMWANHAIDDFVLEIDNGSSLLIPSCSSARIIFDKPGVYEYHEKNHRHITGKVIVLENYEKEPITEFEFEKVKKNIEKLGYDVCDVRLQDFKIILDLNKIFKNSESEKRIISQIPSDVNYEIIYHDGYTDYFINTITSHICD